MATWHSRALAVAALTSLMTACGGGNGGSSGAAAPPTQAPGAATNLSLAYAAKSIVVGWDAVAGATSYDVYEDPDGPGPEPAARIAAGITSNRYTVAVPVLLNERVAAQYTVRACNAAGCSADAAPLQADVLKAVGYFKASNPGMNDDFGTSVALSRDGLTMAVGAPGERSNATGIDGNQSDNSIQGAGAVYLFARVAGGWVQQAYVKPPTPATTDEMFGWTVALSGDGNTLAVGADDDSGATGVNRDFTDVSKPHAGGVYVYTRSGATWTREAYLKAHNTDAGDEFGVALALSSDGNTLAVGARGEDSSARAIDGDGSDNAANGAGAAYVFSRTAGSWAQQSYLKASNADAADNFGQSVSLSGDGNLLVVGAPGERSNAEGVDGDASNNSVDSGAAYVFGRSGSAWSQQHYLKASNSGSSRNFGYAVAVSRDGRTIAIGGSMERSASRGINQSTTSSPTGAGTGAAWVFVPTPTAWQQQAYIKASNADPSDLFGSSLALSDDGNLLAVGAPAEDSAASGFDGTQDNDFAATGSGASYLFDRNGTAWTQRSYVKATNPGQLGNFGISLALGGDGTSLAVGSSGESGTGSGIMGSQQADSSTLGTGAVYLY